MALCNGCKTKTAITVWTFSQKDVDGNSVEVCNECSNVKLAPEYPRDASGNRVIVPTGYSQYSYAIDAPITGARQYSEHLRRNNLTIKEK